MKVISNETPNWFWNSKSFTEGKRLPEYAGFPTVVIPTNKKVAQMLRTDAELSLVQNQKSPLEKLGNNFFYGNLGGLTNYPNSKLIKFTDLSHGANPTDESQWGMATYPDKIQWLNGELSLGYCGRCVAENISKRDKLRAVLGNAISANPGIELTVYSWEAISSFGDWYNATPQQLSEPYTNPNLIYSAQLDCGFNALMQQIYSINDTHYDYPAFLIYQKQLAEIKYPNVNLYALIWSENETVDNYPLLRTAKRKRQDNVFIGLSGIKHNTEAQYMYNSVLIGASRCDGIFSWEGTQVTVTTEDPQYEDKGWEFGINLQRTVGTETWGIDNTRVWKSVMLYWNLALYHLSLHKDILEGTVNKWFTPDFYYENNLRTGNQKMIPYNKFYKEPVVQLKYNDNKSKASLLVYNPWGTNINSKVVRVIDPVTNLDITVPVNGTKAELYKIEF